MENVTNQKYAPSTKVQLKSPRSRRHLDAAQQIIIIVIIDNPKIAAVLILTCFGSGLPRNFLSNLVRILLINLAINSPTEFNVSKVIGIPSRDTKIHNV